MLCSSLRELLDEAASRLRHVSLSQEIQRRKTDVCFP